MLKNQSQGLNLELSNLNLLENFSEGLGKSKGWYNYTMPNVGDMAPDFLLLDQAEKSNRLSDYRGNWVFLYFYPKDDTPGCTTEACSVRDNFSELVKLGVKVFGVSVDSVKSHQKFVEKYRLNFTLLSDNQKKVVQDYGVWGEKSFMGKKYMGTHRTSFLINPNGKIVKVYPKVKPLEHVAEVVKDLSAYSSNN